jgi:hypothetical protein
MSLVWVGTLGTAIVGIVGIVATYLSARKARITQIYNLQLSIDAENDRARLAEKRRIYSEYMFAISSYVAIERSLAAARNKNAVEDSISVLCSELSKSMTIMLRALCEVRLIAPETLSLLAGNVVAGLATSEDTSLIFPQFRDELYKAMRCDLDEPEHQAIELPEIVSRAIERLCGNPGRLGFRLLACKRRSTGWLPATIQDRPAVISASGYAEVRECSR